MLVVFFIELIFVQISEIFSLNIWFYELGTQQCQSFGFMLQIQLIELIFNFIFEFYHSKRAQSIANSKHFFFQSKEKNCLFHKSIAHKKRFRDVQKSDTLQSSSIRLPFPLNLHRSKKTKTPFIFVTFTNLILVEFAVFCHLFRLIWLFYFVSSLSKFHFGKTSTMIVLGSILSKTYNQMNYPESLTQ